MPLCLSSSQVKFIIYSINQILLYFSIFYLYAIYCLCFGHCFCSSIYFWFAIGSCFCRKGNSCLRNCAKWIFDFPIQFSILWTEYFYLCHIYSIIKREAVSNFVVPADFRTDYSAVAYIAKYFGRNRGMACSTDSRANHYGCSIGFSSSEQREVSLRIKEDVHAVRRLIKKPLCGGKIIMRQNRI